MGSEGFDVLTKKRSWRWCFPMNHRRSGRNLAILKPIPDPRTLAPLVPQPNLSATESEHRPPKRGVNRRVWAAVAGLRFGRSRSCSMRHFLTT